MLRFSSGYLLSSLCLLLELCLCPSLSSNRCRLWSVSYSFLCFLLLSYSVFLSSLAFLFLLSLLLCFFLAEVSSSSPLSDSLSELRLCFFDFFFRLCFFLFIDLSRSFSLILSFNCSSLAANKISNLVSSSLSSLCFDFFLFFSLLSLRECCSSCQIYRENIIN